MRLRYLELAGFKSFAKKTKLDFDTPITSVVGPNGSGKSNVAEAFRWVLGEQSLKSLRGKRGEDLIFNGGGAGSRLNRASVSIAFDNTGRPFDIDYDEVILTRSVHRDGANEYSINGSQVRLRDILELLSNVSLGSTGHHIISQGEADRILNANIKERREMIEEALGLKIYHWKIGESEKKLAKTEANIKEVESLRREIAPHLKFLKKQVEKVAQADDMRRALKTLYLTYFWQEEKYLNETKQEISAKKREPEESLKKVVSELEALTNQLKKDQSQGDDQAIANLEKRLRDIRNKKDELSRQIGRLEGIIEIREEVAEEAGESAMIPVSVVEELVAEAESFDEKGRLSGDVDILRKIIGDLKQAIVAVVRKYKTATSEPKSGTNLANARKERDDLNIELAKLLVEEKEVSKNLTDLKKNFESEKLETIGAEKRLYELRAEKSEVSAKLDILKAQSDRLAHEEADFSRELAEAKALVDQEMANYGKFYQGPNELESRTAQASRRKEIERLKIRLEDMGMDGADVTKEYDETTKRDEYLATELIDLHKSAESLAQVMAELKEKLLVEFGEGIKKINSEFANFLSLLFGGGTASLRIIKEEKRRRQTEDLLEAVGEDFVPEEKEPEEGIEISVNLPRKKIKGLEMLSGGERALTSIALLFSMSQVNPPPFLVLDETDAALDESNSRKYGDMIENLAKRSQLILITHNRETMSRAGVLYGVTMSGDGMSKLLSIKFAEAESYAKQ